MEIFLFADEPMFGDANWVTGSCLGSLVKSPSTNGRRRDRQDPLLPGAQLGLRVWEGKVLFILFVFGSV